LNQNIKSILKKEIPLRKVEFKGKVVISSIILIIAFILGSIILTVIGILFFGYFYFVYTNGSIYSTYKAISATFYLHKEKFGLNNKETIEQVIEIRNSSFINKSDSSFLYNSLEFLQKYISAGFFNYDSEILIIYTAAAGIWIQENPIPEDEYSVQAALERFFDDQIMDLMNMDGII